MSTNLEAARDEEVSRFDEFFVTTRHGDTTFFSYGPFKTLQEAKVKQNEIFVQYPNARIFGGRRV